jgi:acyl dehydratase
VAINAEKLLGAELSPVTSSWQPNDVILYHLGIGAGVTTSPSELRFVYERDLRVLPTYAVIPGMAVLAGLQELPGLDADFALMLHGEQEVTLAAPLPSQATAQHVGRVSGVYDKGGAALVVLDTESHDADSGALLATNRVSLFFRGEGGFGGDPGPASGPAAPDRPADHIVEVATLPQQAALYRLNGDSNPLHIDPEFARLGGFDRPILHGLCTFGAVCKAAIDEALDGDVTPVGGYRARFAGVLFPGETLVVEIWRESDRFAVRATCKERAAPVLSHAALTVVP